MRVYAILLGMVLTAGSAYLAHVAIGSAGFERLTPSSSSREGSQIASELWYGGVLDPITIEAAPRTSGSTLVFAAPAPAGGELSVSQQATECSRRARPKPHVRPADNAHASAGSMM